MRINTNIPALSAQRILARTSAELGQSIARLSSGFRINRAADDAAGLGIANRLRADGRSLLQATRNAEQATSLLQIAESAAGTVQDILVRMKELATQARSDNTDVAGRQRINAEFEQLRDEIARIVNTTKFQDSNLLDGSFGNRIDTDVANSTILDSGTTAVASASISGTKAGTYTFSHTEDGKLTVSNDDGSMTQTVDVADGAGTYHFSLFSITIKTESGFDSEAAGSPVDGTALVVTGGNEGEFMVSSSGHYGSHDLVKLGSMDVTVETLGLDGEALDTSAGAESALSAIDSALGELASVLGDIGAAQNRIDYALRNVRVTYENVAAAESTIRDADFAYEMAEFSRAQILQQVGTAMLAQANSAPAAVLRLLQ